MSLDITIGQRDMARIMAKACTVVSDKSSKPIMGCAIIRADNGALHVSSADDNITIAITSRVACEVAKPGTIAVSAKDLLARIQLHQAGPVRLVERSGKLEVIGIGTKKKHVLSTAIVADYPTLPVQDASIAPIRLVSRAFARMIAHVDYAISTDVTRSNVNCASVEFDGTRMHVTGTDGSRLSTINSLVATDAPMKMLIQQQATIQLRKVIESSRTDIESSNIDIAVSPASMFFTIGGTCICVKQVAAEYPSWRSAVPARHKPFDIGRAKLIDMIRSAEVGSSNGVVMLDFGATELRVWSKNETGESSDDTSISFDGKPYTSSFHAKYMCDTLNALESDQVRMFVSPDGDPLDQILVRPVTDKTDEGFDGIFMPCRL